MDLILQDDDADGICNADEIEGCLDTLACNYDPSATDIGSCTFPIGCETCDGLGGVLTNDDDSDGVCDLDERFIVKI